MEDVNKGHMRKHLPEVTQASVSGVWHWDLGNRLNTIRTK